MLFTETKIPGLYVIELEKREDARGYFARAWCAKEFADHRLPAFVQTNMSMSRVRGTIRGLHYQLAPHGEAKYVRCVRGAIFDVAVDLRPDSPTRGQWEGYELDDESHRQLLVPARFGHGFCVLSDEADVGYKLSSYYDPETEAGFAWDDPEIGIEWPISDPLLSERDKSAPKLSEIAAELPW